METRNKIFYLRVACSLFACLALGYGAYVYFFSSRNYSEVAKLAINSSSAGISEKSMDEPTHLGRQKEASNPEQSNKLFPEKISQTSDVDSLRVKSQAPEKQLETHKPALQAEEVVTLSPDEEGEVAMTEDELKALHEKQEAEAAAALQLDKAVPLLSEEDGVMMSALQLKGLHDKQEAELAAQPDDTLVPLSEDDTPLSVRQIKALHEEQLREEEISSSNEIQPLTNEDDPATTAWDLKALHDLQENEIEASRDSMDVEVIPAQNGEEPKTISVQVLRNLHAQQNQEAQPQPIFK
ncbi:hypothetical protein [Desulfoferrobacter suflitae]|uniref:hypothetical protein n=1 Tax=Desulfoferrobacter suflitae TaxID=2865782 RepID=UPI002164811F|nr:hypothetical protein [Desulfoferrobacter suflitae]MCK8604347.1 hypothetical protein [Desulfoferrobacter suflitae]